ncbi:tRNA lysidine(34) synthetase TilS [Aliidiomarina quisquiliarum]|uniref:tRNA lysidine(34) synthetase TilS n=1 Tax=Aliidiomarina quisquiliarum TaxID=2938947 RepID=UPI00208F728A|nr:tRNA lysidine(34) synthetase TilS [Aliidiomarina quisquiliarum]MCO4320081.1 tRNA lysidine(34) synthetase TilS [Aliidiomarina quisquiliarum]
MVTADLYPIFEQGLARLGLQAGQQIVVALGGGVDSQTILDLTDRYRRNYPQYRYLAIHLDHSFHPKSGAWSAFLQNDCERRNFPYLIEPLHIVQGPRESKEAIGRDARYAGLAERTEHNAVILIGQHRSDQIETFLLQLKRGAGPKGLSAMAFEAPFVGQRRLCRPLLSISKSELYAYGEAFKVQWIEDDTNYDTRIERNFLRHDIIPRLKSRWPAIEHTVLRSAELCAEHEGLLNELLSGLMETISQGNVLALEGWQQRSVAMQKAILRRWLEQNGAKMPSAAVLSELIQQLSRLPQGKVGVRWGTWAVQRNKRQLILTFVDKD